MSNATTCNPESIDDFLADRLDEQQQSAFERHLDQCDDCCRELQQRTADVALWDDARTFLTSTDNAPACSTTCAVIGGGETAPTSGDAPRLDFLGPTDDPHMLGRFGGYEISGVIGCGGMGIVLKGFDAALNRYVAIKVLAPHYATSGAARQRFAREAQAAAAVVHDNVIAIHGVAESNGLPYLVMPYVKGESLQKRIDRGGAMAVAEILRVAMQTARGLAAAHDQGLVHRDIKPGNLLLPENVERVMITDFGLARAADDASLTRSGVIAGTPQFMSPEQARGEGVDTRSDLFSLGSVIYTMCTGRPPFRAETPYGILRRITDDDPRPILEINPNIPQWLCRIVNRLLARDPAKRFDSADEVAHLLEECLAHLQQPNLVPLPAQLAGLGGDSRPLRRLAIGAAAMVAVAALLWPLLGDRHTPSSNDGAPDAVAGSATTVTPSETQDAAKGTTDEPATEAELQWWPDRELDRVEQSLNELNTELSIEEFDAAEFEQKSLDHDDRNP